MGPASPSLRRHGRDTLQRLVTAAVINLMRLAAWAANTPQSADPTIHPPPTSEPPRSPRPKRSLAVSE